MAYRVVKGFIAGFVFAIIVMVAFGYVSVPSTIVLDNATVIKDTPTQTVDVEYASEDSRTESSDSTELNATRVELLVHQLINEHRQEHGLDPLGFDQELEAIASEHSQDMVDRDFYSHINPDGEDFSDRYTEARYSCERQINESYTTGGAENILFTYYEEPLRDGAYYDSPMELAEGIVNQWLESPPHHENIDKSYWRYEGIGIAVTEDQNGTRVYATQNFC